MKEYQKDMMKAFARAAAKREGMSSNDFIDAILEERPDLRGLPVYVPGQGGLGYTVFIGDEVFKGPRYSQDEHLFDKECEVLRQFKDTGLLAPQLTYVGKKNIFCGMTRMPGVTLFSVAQYDITKVMTEDERRALANDVVDFVIGMAKAFPMRDNQYLCHKDMHENNVLIDPETKRLTAVIDFGLTTYVSKDDLLDYVYLPMASHLMEEYERRKDELPAPVSKRSVAQLKVAV